MRGWSWGGGFPQDGLDGRDSLDGQEDLDDARQVTVDAGLTVGLVPPGAAEDRSAHLAGGQGGVGVEVAGDTVHEGIDVGLVVPLPGGRGEALAGRAQQTRVEGGGELG